MNVSKGKFLLSDPFLEDEAFSRSLLLMIEHNEEGSFGLIVNKKMPYKVDEVLNGFLKIDNNLYFGGPVDTDRLFFIHKTAELKDAEPIAEGLYWNGDINELKDMLEIEYIKPEEIRFFLGYSGWGAGQLDEEMEENSWIVSNLDTQLLFEDNDDLVLWQKAMIQLGEPYAEMINFPVNPKYN
jgi:putative transcriptional regulator